MLFSILLQLVYSSLHGSCSVFAFGVLRFFCFVLPAMTGCFGFFWFENFKLFPVKPHFFRRPLIFVRSDCNLRGFEIAPAGGSPASVIGHVMTTRDYINVSRSGFDFLILALQCSNNFILNAFFKFASVNFFLATWFMFSFCPRGLVVFLFCSPYDDWIFLVFLVWNFQTVPR